MPGAVVHVDLFAVAVQGLLVSKGVPQYGQFSGISGSGT